MDETIKQAKGEVEGYVLNKLIQTGIENVDPRGLLPEGDSSDSEETSSL